MIFIMDSMRGDEKIFNPVFNLFHTLNEGIELNDINQNFISRYVFFFNLCVVI
jgi:hypothetical protein